MAGAPDGQLGAVLSGNLQPLQSGAVNVPIAIPLPGAETSAPPPKPSPKPGVELSSPGIATPLSPPSAPPVPLPVPLPPVAPNPGFVDELPQAYSPASTGKTNPRAAIPRRMTLMGNLHTMNENSGDRGRVRALRLSARSSAPELTRAPRREQIRPDRASDSAALRGRR